MSNKIKEDTDKELSNDSKPNNLNDNSNSLNSYVNTSSIDNPINVKEYFSFLQTNMDDYSDVLMDKEVAQKVKQHLISLRTGTHATVPLICPGGTKCPIVARCPLLKRKPDGSKDLENSKFPVLRPCPFEKHLMAWKMQTYVEEFEIDINSHSSIALVTKLAELDIYEMRVDIQLSSGDRFGEGTDLLQKTVEAMNPINGKITHSLRIHPLWEIKERLGKQRQQLLTSLIGTPREKLKAAHMLGEVEKPSDLVNEMSALKSRLSDMIKMRQEDVNIVDAEFTSCDEELPDDDM
tara:strand:- start:42792 stop:43670 length:879 start_codon:yes stop_codon:yes gene_type:complete